MSLSIPGALIVTSRLYAEFQATATIDQRMMALEPVISDQDRKELRRLSAMMEGRKDYDNINSRMESLAKTHNIKLPPPYI
jgi:hypothetical protein